MNKDKREILLETFGSLPEDQDGKKLKGVTFGKPEVGDVRLTLHGTWAEMMAEQNLTGQRPIAIYEDTHRADGTPMEIDALPEVEGRRVEFHGKRLNHISMGDACGYAYFVTNYGWKIVDNDLHPNGLNNTDSYYALIFKIAQPTTLEDLKGSDYSKPLFLHHKSEDGKERWSEERISRTKSGNLMIGGNCIWNCKKQGYRWSNSPATAFADANEFVAEGGSNE